MPTILRPLVLLFLLLSGNGTSAAAPQATPLVLRLERERPVRFEATTETETQMALEGLDLTSVLTLHQECELETVGVEPDGTHTIRVRIGRVHGRQVMPMLGAFEFDSAKPDPDLDPMLGQIFGVMTCLTGKEFEARVSARGVVEDLTGDEKVYDGLVLPPMAKGMGLSFDGGTDLRPTVQQFFARIPAEAARAGAVTSQEVTLATPRGAVRFTTQLSVSEVTPEHAAWTLSSEEPVADDAPHWKADGDGIRSAVHKASCRLSVADGLPIEQTSETTSDLSLIVPLSPEPVDALFTVRQTVKRILAPAEAAGDTRSGR